MPPITILDSVEETTPRRPPPDPWLAVEAIIALLAILVLLGAVALFWGMVG